MRLTSHAGIIIGVSVLVAAGIAVYESPQFKQWVTTSRRKIALALHNLGDEIQPQDIPMREDISMTEETGEIAEERRRIARAEITRRATFLESRQKAGQRHQPHNSFDTLVDNEGNLLKDEDQDFDTQPNQVPTANSTGVDLGISEPLRRGGKPIEPDSPTHSRNDHLHVDIPSSTPSNHPSESMIQFTPTSDKPEGEGMFDPFSPNSPLSVSGSSHTEEHQQTYYAHPDGTANEPHENGRLAELGNFGHEGIQSHDVSAAPSTTGSFSHVGGFDDETSDGTLSDLGGRSVGAATPASWSEVGSVISDEDAGHHHLL